MTQEENIAAVALKLKELALARRATVGTAESCTGGLIAAAITAVPGSSEYFLGGVVSYANSVKAKLLGVPEEILGTVGAVSGECARFMAQGAATALGADWAVSVTGVAGPTGGDAVRPVGTVYLGAARGDTVYVEKLFVSRPDRALIRARAAQEALVLALRLAQDKVPAATKPLAAADCRDAAALEALNAAFLAE